MREQEIREYHGTWKRAVQHADYIRERAIFGYADEKLEIYFKKCHRIECGCTRMVRPHLP